MSDPAVTEDPGPTASGFDRAMARGMFVAASFAAVAGLARIVQDAGIAWRYGTGPAVDAYYFVLNLANWPVTMALSLLTLLVAPVEATLVQRNATAYRRWRGELLGRVLLAAGLSLPLAAWLLHGVAGSSLSGLDAASRSVAAAGVPLIVAAVPLGLLGALLSAWLIAAGRHVVTLLEAVPPLVMSALLLTAPGVVLFWGTTLGVAVQALAMAAVLHAAAALPRPTLHRATDTAEHHRAFARGALVMLAGQLLFTLFPLVDPFFAARQGEGEVAALSYASRLVLGLQGLAGLALQRAGLPLLSKLGAASPAEARRATLRWAAGAGAVGVVMSIAVALLADPAVGLLFERGHFTADNREHVARLLRYGALQLPIYLAGTVVVTALASVRGSTGLALAAGVGLLAKVALSAALVAELGVPGLLVATALMYLVTSTIAWFALSRRLARPADDAA